MGNARWILVGDRYYVARPSNGRWSAQEIERHAGARISGYNVGFRPVPRGRVPSGTFRTMSECHDAIRAMHDADSRKDGVEAMTTADLSELHACLDSLDRDRAQLADDNLGAGLRSLIASQMADTIAELRERLPALPKRPPVRPVVR